MGKHVDGELKLRNTCEIEIIEPNNTLGRPSSGLRVGSRCVLNYGPNLHGKEQLLNSDLRRSCF
ncbi:uncharacterized protein FOMMEDRAFT_133991 [Fomitiporia mediterranea MF3/22]|uniref:uncharacterized protein n=1 Tax=Fomitiporia mediterranea (strain MF3/22) TaxID=694068 RepID=UPI0004409B8E|nr:uncharacterized protein FOMMEDRAFT_133991 [Fomitiporia mediterranea MF3/22]EJD02765.1 hypothetical protein FOMMEDRAFT_133991 [Fomitiporia mediterranea MF3/22]